MKLGSLFDGIGAFPLSAIRHGIEPIWASEIEPFPIEVSKKHFPDMKHLGDIREIDGADIEPVDIITAGSPCQNLSMAGTREGLKGEQSSLFYEFVRVAREMREKTDGRYPKYIIWENVRGALSSNKGQDFRAVLEEILETEISMPYSGRCANAGMVRGDGRSLAWIIFDAQYWGVPQRRKRIFLVADFRGQSAPEILFESEGVSRDITESRKAWQEVAATAREGVEGASAISIFDIGDRRRVADENVGICPTLTTKMGTGGNNVPVFLQKIDCTPNGISGTVSSKWAQGQAVCSIDCRNLRETEQSGTLQAKSSGGYSLNYQNPVRVGYAVRRLTPTECERLMGFPDGWTDGGSDSARYKALGNSIAVPCLDWIMGQLVNKVVK